MNAIVRASVIGTATFVLATVAALVATSPATRALAVAVAVAEFVLGCVAFLWAFGTAVRRSRVDAIGIGGLYFLAGDTAPRDVRRVLQVAMAVQVITAVGGAALRPFTTLAFGILAPVYALGLAGLWGARHGHFGPRSDVAEG